MIHLLALPNAQTTSKYDLDGFNTATMRMGKVLNHMGVPFILYAGEENEIQCQELVTCVTKAEQKNFLQGLPYQAVEIHPNGPLWQMSNPRMAAAIKQRATRGDLILTIGGGSQKAVTDANPGCLAVEYNIGYVGCYSQYRVFQSQAWRHMIYGMNGMHNTGRYYDAVIPAFFEVDTFPENAPEDYVVYVGRIVPKKGIAIACQAAEAAGVKLKIIGHGDTSQISYGEYLGPLPTAERNEIVSKARALIAPTVYVEPFGCIGPEAMLSGVPVIAPSFGGFTETVEHGKTGFHCDLFGEFVSAIAKADTLDRAYIRERARRLYSIEAAAWSYAKYFRRLNTLWGQGWATHPYDVVTV